MYVESFKSRRGVADRLPVPAGELELVVLIGMALAQSGADLGQAVQPEDEASDDVEGIQEHECVQLHKPVCGARDAR